MPDAVMALIAYAAGLGRDKGQQGGIIMDGQQVPRLHNGCGPAQPLELAFFFLEPDDRTLAHGIPDPALGEPGPPGQQLAGRWRVARADGYSQGEFFHAIMIDGLVKSLYFTTEHMEITENIFFAVRQLCGLCGKFPVFTAGHYDLFCLKIGSMSHIWA